jgi:hypothetical protein
MAKEIKDLLANLQASVDRARANRPSRRESEMPEQHPMFASKEAALPYSGTGGHSGSTASKDMAEQEAADGTVAARQREILNRIALSGPRGETVADLRDAGANHHGKASSTLTTLHKVGKIARLAERRDRCSIYVLPEHVEGRTTVPPGGNKAAERRTLTATEAEWTAGIAARVKAHNSPTIEMQTGTVLALLGQIEYLNG